MTEEEIIAARARVEAASRYMMATIRARVRLQNLGIQAHPWTAEQAAEAAACVMEIAEASGVGCAISPEEYEQIMSTPTEPTDALKALARRVPIWDRPCTPEVTGP